MFFNTSSNVNVNNNPVVFRRKNDPDAYRDIDPNSLIEMRVIMAEAPQDGDDPFFFSMKRIQQCVWFLRQAVKTSTIGFTNPMRRAFMNIVGNEEATANKAAFAADRDWGRYGDKYRVWPATRYDINDAFKRGIKKIKAEESLAARLDVLWSFLWEFTNNGNPNFLYSTEIIIRNPAEYKYWRDKVFRMIEVAYDYTYKIPYLNH